MWEWAGQFAAVFVPVAFRLLGFMMLAPLFGARQVPVRLRLLIIVVLAAALTPGIHAVIPADQSAWRLAMAYASEAAIGLVIGLLASFVFIGARWAGEMIGQQMGLSIAGVIDPQSGDQGSGFGDLYFLFTLVVFLLVGGHRAMIRGVRASFDAMPIYSVHLNATLVQSLVQLLTATTVLALQLAAPVLITVVIVDLVLALVGRSVPQIGMMSMALGVRAAVAILLVGLGVYLSGDVIGNALLRSMQQIATAAGLSAG